MGVLQRLPSFQIEFGESEEKGDVMKKVMVAILALTLSLMMATVASAQQNKLAFFDIDSNIGTAGFQGGKVVTGIGANARVGLAIYVKNVDQLRTITVDFTWDGTKAAFNSDSGFGIDLEERNVNGVSVTATEANMMTADGSSVSGVGEINEAGHYAITFAKLGGTAVASSDYGLVYFLVLRTTASFTTATQMTVKASIKALNDAGVEKDLGVRDFYVNGGGVDVKTSTWGEIKSQFKE